MTQSERERLIEELRTANERLVMANLHAQEQAEKLAEAHRRKDEFLAMLAHELRNPLAPIRSAIDIFNTASASLNSELQSALAILDRQVNHLTRLVDDLLDVSRLLRGQIELQKQPTLLVDILKQAIETAQPLIEAQRHQFTVTVPPKPIALEADSQRLAQAVANLLLNAAKYTEPGGTIELELQQQGNEAQIQVRDTGIGLRPESLETIFSAFTQENSSLARPQGGLGLGLALVRNLVEMHGGRVQAFSEGPGRGSEFVVHLPVLAPAHGSIEDKPNSSSPAHNGAATPYRILLVEDNPDVAHALAQLLKILGHTVSIAYDGKAALETALTFQPEVVLVDIGLPGMDGYEVAKRLRQSPVSITQLIALSGYGQAEDKRRAQAAGFDRHLTKPVDVQALQKILSR
jgi:CheY-like chemotaxis protein